LRQKYKFLIKENNTFFIFLAFINIFLWGTVDTIDYLNHARVNLINQAIRSKR
jgi:hypothetical protein